MQTELELIAKRTISHETYRYVFPNDPFVYIEVYENNVLKDTYFAHHGDLWPDGTLRKNKKKYFYSNRSGEDIQKRVERLSYLKFKYFDKLYSFDESGDIVRIDGTPAARCNYNVLEE